MGWLLLCIEGVVLYGSTPRGAYVRPYPAIIVNLTREGGARPVREERGPEVRVRRSIGYPRQGKEFGFGILQRVRFSLRGQTLIPLSKTWILCV